MKRHTAALGIGLLVTSIYIGVIGVLRVKGAALHEDDAFGYGVMLLATASAGAWLVLPLWQRRDGPK